MYPLTAKVAKTSASFHYQAGNTIVVLLLCITLERREGKAKENKRKKYKGMGYSEWRDKTLCTVCAYCFVLNVVHMQLQLVGSKGYLFIKRLKTLTVNVYSKVGWRWSCWLGAGRQQQAIKRSPDTTSS